MGFDAFFRLRSDNLMALQNDESRCVARADLDGHGACVAAGNIGPSLPAEAN